MISTLPDSSQLDGVAGTTRSASVECAQTATGVYRIGVLSPVDCHRQHHRSVRDDHPVPLERDVLEVYTLDISQTVEE